MDFFLSVQLHFTIDQFFCIYQPIRLPIAKPIRLPKVSLNQFPITNPTTAHIYHLHMISNNFKSFLSFIKLSSANSDLFTFKLAGGEQHFMLFADGKSTGDSRFSGARGCSHLDGTK